jgi:ABC-type glycerol-3-phosphate transport system substrate-binding protein
MINRVNTEVQIENNPVLKYIREKFGFNIQLEAPPINNYNERLQIVMASGDLPDLVYVWSLNQNYIQWAEQGLIRPVDDLVKKYPNIMHNVTPDMFDVASIASTGKAYGVPRTNKINYWGYIVNAEWLKKLGVSAPTTLDEFYELGKLVRDNDPDGNGQADTYLFSPDGDIAKGGTEGSPIGTAFIPPDSTPDFDGVYKIREKRSGYYPFLDYMRKLYAEKIIDPEYITNKTYGNLEKVRMGRVAVVGSFESSAPMGQLDPQYPFLDFAPAIKSPDGKAYNYVAPAVWGVWVLPASSKKTEDALRFLDWGNSPEGYQILNLGVPGVHYNSYDFNARMINQTEEQWKLAQTATGSYMCVSYAYEGLAPLINRDSRIVDYYNKRLADYKSKVTEVTVPSIKNPEMDAFNANNPDLVTRKTEMENKYVTGAVSKVELQNFINNEYLPKIAAAEAAYLKITGARK